MVIVENLLVSEELCS